MAWLHARWVQVAWLDTLLKRLYDLLLSVGVSLGTLLLLAYVVPTLGDGPARASKGLLYTLIVFAVWIMVSFVKLIVLPIRASISGTFLDEYAAEKAKKSQRDQQRLKAGPGPTEQYQGVDPVHSGLSLHDRVWDAWSFTFRVKRMPSVAAAVGTDEYYYAQTLKELVQALRSGTVTREHEKLGKQIDSLSKTWRDDYLI